MLLRVFLILECVRLLVVTGAATAHSLQEIDRLFEEEAVPTELVEVTKELDMTAGVKTVREQVHARQHELLEQYLQARIERKCTESVASISRLDLEIVELQERGQHEAEQAKRELRDTTAAFLAKNCTAGLTD
jgi:hypothetical protein